MLSTSPQSPRVEPGEAIVIDASLRGNPLQAYAARLETDGGIVLAYRGSIGTDWILDIEFTYAPYNGSGCQGCGEGEG